jgi:chorismate dehydratase
MKHSYRQLELRDIMRSIRIGAVSYLNSKPLIEDLAELAPEAELILDFPSRLADQLGRGELDVALIPSIECVLGPKYEIVSDACVATHGPVLSVKLYSRVPMSEIRTLALDEGSRTSAALSKVLLAERFGLKPSLERLPMTRDTRDTSADAVLLIGDRAIHPPAEQFSEVWDLGEEWTNWTGLPFVFAMWATRAGTELGPVEEALCRSRDLGLQRLPEIAAREAPLLGLTKSVTLEYLSENLYYRLGTAERRGFQRYQELAVKQGLAPKGYDLVFRHCALA